MSDTLIVQYNYCAKCKIPLWCNVIIVQYVRYTYWTILLLRNMSDTIIVQYYYYTICQRPLLNDIIIVQYVRYTCCAILLLYNMSDDHYCVILLLWNMSDTIKVQYDYYVSKIP